MPMSPPRPQVRLTTLVSISVIIAALMNAAPSAASRDHSDLHHQKSILVHSINAKQGDLGEVSSHLLRTQAHLSDAQDGLHEARVQSSIAHDRVRRAEKVDRRARERLRAAITRLDAAREDLEYEKDVVRANRAVLAAWAVNDYQTSGSLELAIAFGSKPASDVVDELQAADTLLDKQSSALQKFEATTVLLKLTAQRVHMNAVAVAERRAIASVKLTETRQHRVLARAAAQAVATRVDRLRRLRGDLVAAKRAEKHRLRVLKLQRNHVESRLRAIAERRASRHAISLALSGAAPVDALGNGYLEPPVRDSYVTSPYGMRMHPILHIRELHDGTDFHAACGSPVYAAATGQVISEYLNTGYGKRLLLDNGYIRGASLTTSYNHLSSYVVKVGERVERGQLIAYSGDTGWSTACHLHFMVYINGETVDPMTWL